MLFFTFREKSVSYVFVNFPFDVQKLLSPLYWANRIGIQAMLLETAKFRTYWLETVDAFNPMSNKGLQRSS